MIAVTDPSQPPSANRGVETTDHERRTDEARTIDLLPAHLVNASVDWLSVTVGAADDLASVGAALVAATTLEEPGRPQAGFRASERRQCLGGSCYRKRDPHQPSKRWGELYESWEWSGGPASWAAGFLRGRFPALKPTRVDIAFDFSCGAEFTSDDFAAAVEDHHDSRGVSGGVSGQGGVNTRYIGASTSEVRIRVYRKDLQDPSFAEFIGPTLRVELVLKGDRALAWWSLWDQDEEAAKQAASSLVHDYTGFRPLAGDHGWPELELPAASDEAERLALFVNQHGPQLVAWHQAGVDVVALAKSSGVATKNRTAAHRLRKRVQAVLAVGASEIVAIARSMLQRRPAVDVAA